MSPVKSNTTFVDVFTHLANVHKYTNVHDTDNRDGKNPYILLL